MLTGKAARLEGELALLDAAYPMLALPPELAARWTMVHAISRQETQFDRAAISAANARGLMQLLPATAAETAAKLGLPYATARLTDDPVFNVTLGAAYYARIRDNLGGSHLLAVAAYNAGPGNVRRFIAMNGDPRLPGRRSRRLGRADPVQRDPRLCPARAGQCRGLRHPPPGDGDDAGDQPAERLSGQADGGLARAAWGSAAARLRRCPTPTDLAYHRVASRQRTAGRLPWGERCLQTTTRA